MAHAFLTSKKNKLDVLFLKQVWKDITWTRSLNQTIWTNITENLAFLHWREIFSCNTDFDIWSCFDKPVLVRIIWLDNLRHIFIIVAREQNVECLKGIKDVLELSAMMRRRVRNFLKHLYRKQSLDLRKRAYTNPHTDVLLKCTFSAFITERIGRVTNGN